jgi:hypothetical protein
MTTEEAYDNYSQSECAQEIQSQLERISKIVEE